MANLNQPTGPKPETVGLAKKLTKSVKKDGVNLAEAMSILDLTKYQTRTVLRAAESEGLLRREGTTSTTRYFKA